MSTLGGGAFLTYGGQMTANVRPLDDHTFEVLDYSLFMYGLVRGDAITLATEGTPHYAELAVYELDGLYRLGIPYFEKHTIWTRLSGLVTASKVEFTVAPQDRERVVRLGHVDQVVRSALRGVG